MNRSHQNYHKPPKLPQTAKSIGFWIDSPLHTKGFQRAAFKLKKTATSKHWSMLFNLKGVFQGGSKKFWKCVFAAQYLTSEQATNYL